MEKTVILFKNKMILLGLALVTILLSLQDYSEPTPSQILHAEDLDLPEVSPQIDKEEPTTEDEAIRTFMVIKLKSSQKILSGLTSENFKTIEKEGQELINMSLASSWQVYETPNYKKDSEVFRGHAKELVKAAKAKKLDKCTDHYLKVVRSCVECHEHVRKSKIVSLPSSSAHGLGE